MNRDIQKKALAAINDLIISSRESFNTVQKEMHRIGKTQQDLIRLKRIMLLDLIIDLNPDTKARPSSSITSFGFNHEVANSEMILCVIANHEPMHQRQGEPGVTIDYIHNIIQQDFGRNLSHKTIRGTIYKLKKQRRITNDGGYYILDENHASNYQLYKLEESIKRMDAASRRVKNGQTKRKTKSDTEMVLSD